MIKITLQGETLTFEKSPIVIGSDRLLADVVINETGVEKIHIQLIEDEDRFLAVNTANDPFSSINGLPFGKKTIKSGDLIQINHISLQIECIISPEKSNSVKSYVAKEVLKEEEDSEEHDNGHLKDINSKKHYFLDEIDDESEHWKMESEAEKLHSKRMQFITRHWKRIALAFFASILFCASTFSGFYFRASDKNSQEEKKIAAGIADIAMAITYANRHHISPSKQNWSDPDFIHTNLSRVLSPNLHSQAQINNQGQFIKHPYILRIYTNGDISRFVIIAQPAPNLLQWLINKTTIIIDSSTMDIRKVADIKHLNKLLANANPLEGKNGLEVSRLIREGTLMSLHCLSGNKNLWGFAPPRALSLTRPGSENSIYNAPRYYPFGEPILLRAVELSRSPGNSSDVTLLQEELKSLEHFPNIVLYSSQGMQPALEAQKALSTYSPESKFIIAYLKFTSNGFVASSHLLMDNDRGQMAFEQKTLLARDHEHPETSTPFSSHEKIYTTDDKISAVNQHHPIYLQLNAVNLERISALKPLSDEIAFLLNQHIQTVIPDFNQKFQDLFIAFQKEDIRQQAKLIEKIAKLYDEYAQLPMQEFQVYIQAMGLSPFVSIALTHRLDRKENSAISEQDLEDDFQKIQKSTNLDELDENVHHLSALLNIDHFSDPEMLIPYQARLRSVTFDRLARFLLSSKENLTSRSLTDDHLTKLHNIFKSSWINNSDEQEFILAEFERIRKQSK